nr:uncharacterized protein LOC127326385 [Lolium perenne]
MTNATLSPTKSRDDCCDAAAHMAITMGPGGKRVFDGESFPDITMEEARKHSPTSFVMQFGCMAPLAVVEKGAELYVHRLQEPTRPCAAEYKKAHIAKAVKAREERNDLMLKARKMLGGLEQLQVTSTPKERVQALEHQKVDLLNELDKAAYVLSWSVRNARSRKNANALRNSKRKRSQIKKMRAQLSHAVTQADMPLQEEGSEYPDPVVEPYMVFPNPLITQPHELKESVR